MNISLQDSDIDKTNRETYIDSLSEKILKLPISSLTKKVLNLPMPFELRDHKIPQEQRQVEKTLLYRLLDKGITGNTGNFGEWSKGFSLWNSYHESEVAKYVISNRITQDDIEQAFIEVNQYLQGFSFRSWIGKDQWHFDFNSEAFNRSMREQLAKNVKGTAQ